MGTSQKKRSTAVTVLIVFLALAVVGTYVPLLFVPEPPPYSDRAGSLADVAAPPVATTTTSTPSRTAVPSGFSDLEKERQSLEEIENSLKPQTP